jgi:hypothetical protein
MEKLVAFCALLLLGACVSSAQDAVETPAPSDADLQARDECLQAYVCSTVGAQSPNRAEL